MLEWGLGMKVFGLHGFTGGPGVFVGLRERFADSARLEAPLLFGHGPSFEGASTDFEGEVERLSGMLDGTTVLIAYSLGARLALGLLASHPMAFCHAILIGPHPGLETDEEREARIRTDETLARRLETERLERFIDAWEALPIFATQKALPESRWAEQRSIRLQHTKEGLAAALRCLGLGRMPSYRTVLGHPPCPVDLVYGAEDASRRELYRHMDLGSGARLIEIPEVSHNVLLEDEGAIEDLLREVIG